MELGDAVDEDEGDAECEEEEEEQQADGVDDDDHHQEQQVGRGDRKRRMDPGKLHAMIAIVWVLFITCFECSNAFVVVVWIRRMHIIWLM